MAMRPAKYRSAIFRDKSPPPRYRRTPETLYHSRDKLSRSPKRHSITVALRRFSRSRQPAGPIAGQTKTSATLWLIGQFTSSFWPPAKITVELTSGTESRELSETAREHPCDDENLPVLRTRGPTIARDARALTARELTATPGQCADRQCGVAGGLRGWLERVVAGATVRRTERNGGGARKRDGVRGREIDKGWESGVRDTRERRGQRVRNNTGSSSFDASAEDDPTKKRACVRLSGLADLRDPDQFPASRRD